MRTLIFWTFWIAYCALATFGYAAEKKSCEVSLTEAQVHGKNVTDDRNAKEQKIASLQTALYMEQQRRQMLEKELADLKQPKEEKKAE